ncbi:DNA primase [Sphingomonas sp. NBWT7]|uniref:DNA primase n=1 Tax=Sphingomonas sp. NBWT7 TaxID=2596913 RepID=UPI00162678BA|nr:DNA primase [Sphingomonas sp. NBWT7]QNE30922.1 DNA primase [Sphingomonas sp. NBWT7]
MSLSPAFLDELRARTSLSALIGKTTKLTKAGREYKGCCPFHNEKTPSFYVNDDKGFYHCFGCSAHGDAIRWMTDQRGLPFIDAVKELAQAAGMDVPAPDKRSAERAEKALSLHGVMQAASEWFAGQLAGLEGAAARELLDRRGISAATARAFGFGFAPDTRGKLRAALKQFGDAMLIEAGLLISVDGKEPYDRFRGRLMIPIRDQRGRVIAFGGRIIGDGEPKYLNSPDTPLFDKGRTLYNLDRALPAARKADRVFVVEGYMDAIALAQAGIGETVAPLGTALTEHQLERLWRIADVPALCFDGDAAGQKAAIRAAHRALPMLAPGRSLSFVTLPEGQDPDDLVRASGSDAFEAVARQRKPLVSVLYQSARAEALTDTPEGRAGLRQAVVDLADKIESKFVQAEYRRALNDLFFEDYGWKRGERKVIGTAVIQTGPHAPRNLLASYMRSVFYGLSRYPAVLAIMMEPVSSLEVTDQRLLPWRDTMIEAVIQRPGLDADALQSILLASKLKPETRHDIQTDLRFPWDADPASSIRTLGGMVEFVHEEQDLLREIDAVNRAVRADPSAEEYLALDRTRSALYAQKAALYDRGFELGGGDSDWSEEE